MNTINYTKLLEQKLNNLKELEKEIPVPLNLHLNEEVKIREITTKEIEIIKKEIAKMSKEDKQILRLLCINKESPYKLSKQLNISPSQLYILKDEALRKLTARVYGTNKTELSIKQKRSKYQEEYRKKNRLKILEKQRARKNKSIEG